MNLNCAVDRIPMKDQKDSESSEAAVQKHGGGCNVRGELVRCAARL